MVIMPEGAARAKELASFLEAMATRFERGQLPQHRDVERIRRAAQALDRLAEVSIAMADDRLSFMGGGARAYDDEGRQFYPPLTK